MNRCKNDTQEHVLGLRCFRSPKVIQKTSPTLKMILLPEHLLDVIPDNITSFEQKLSITIHELLSIECHPPFEDSLTALLFLVYIHKHKANKGQERLQFIKKRKRARFPECFIQSDLWHSLSRFFCWR